MPVLIRIWILLSALLVGAGWILSAFHALNCAGYLIFFALAFVAAIFWWRKNRQPTRQTFATAALKFRKRFKRPAPILFATLFCLALASGILYAPVPGDASMYRTPRVLHWLAEGNWHWIRTFDSRLNTRGTGFEWLTAPLMLFTHSDRLFFLINLFSYALLPGLIFSVFRRLQVRARVAWWWMWLLPAGWCYALQAGTLANDAFATVYALAMVDFALRAAEKKQVADLWFSLLAMALLTGVKQTLIPLGLLWLIAVWPAVRLFFTRPLASAAFFCAALLVSALPMIILNLAHDCSWAGIPRHPEPMDPWARLVALNSPFWGIAGNTFYLLAQNFAPPFIPFYEKWNATMQQFLQTPTGAHFAAFESFAKLPPSLTEQTAGLGLMLCLLVLASMIWIACSRRINFPASAGAKFNWQIRLLWLTPWGLLILFAATVGSIETARLLSPYYPFLLPLILVPTSMTILTRQRWWQTFGLLTMLSAAAILIFPPTRPLWPAETALNHLQKNHPQSDFIARLKSFYSTTEINFALRHAFQSELPPTERVVGYATDIRGLEPTLWIPFTRQVKRILPGDTSLDLRRQDIHYVVVDGPFPQLAGGDIDQLLKRYDARIISQIEIPKGFRQHAFDYVYLLRLNPPAD
jgi:hypothetical protein